MKKRSRLSGPVAVKGVQDAISLVASSLCSETESSTPGRRTRAIKAIEADENLTQQERIKAMRLFRQDIAAADTYLAIDDEELRTEYLKDELSSL